MAVRIETPPTMQGRPEDMLNQMRSYLFRLSENLNIALNDMSKETYTAAAEQTAAARQSGAEAKEESTDTGVSYRELLALIVNTGEIADEATEKLGVLESNFRAYNSEWGQFQENIDTKIETTARETINQYNYEARLTALQQQATGFDEYMTSTEGYIRQGFIDYDENNVPIIGIAIGQGLRSSTVTIGEKEYEEIDRTQSCAFYTADKVSFRVNGQEVAYVSNKKLYIGDMEITGNINIGGKWKISHDTGFGIKWVG